MIIGIPATFVVLFLLHCYFSFSMQRFEDSHVEWRKY